MANVLLRFLLLTLLLVAIDIPRTEARTDRASSSPVNTVTNKDIQSLPTDRNYSDLLRQQPGTAAKSGFKIADNELPRPQDRIFTNYNYLNSRQPNISANYQGINLPGYGYGQGGMCPTNPLQNLRVKDSLNWPGLGLSSPQTNASPTGDLQSRSLYGWNLNGLSLRDFKFDSGGMTQIDPPATPQTTSPTAPTQEPKSVSELTDNNALQQHLDQSHQQLNSLITKYGANNPGTAEARRVLEQEIKDTESKLNKNFKPYMESGIRFPDGTVHSNLGTYKEGPNGERIPISETAPTQATTPSEKANIAPFTSQIRGMAQNGMEYSLQSEFKPQFSYGNALKNFTPEFSSKFKNDWGLGSIYTPIPHYGQFLSDERLGETAGIGGPIISYGVKEKNPLVNIFDASGIPVGSITRDQAKNNPQMTNDLLKFAEDRSKLFQMEDFRHFTNGLTYRKDPTWDSLPSLNYSAGNALNGFNPRSMLMPQLGMSPGDRQTLASGINYQLINNAPAERFFSPMHCCSTVYSDEPVYVREILKKKQGAAIEPNDPLYFDPKHEKKVNRKKDNEPIILGSQIKMFGVVLGAGTTEDRGGINQTADVVDQWGIRAVGYTPKSDPNSAWNSVDASQKNVLVAVIDSGLDLAHPDGPEFVWANPKEIPDNNIDDDNDGYVDDVHGWNFLENNNDLRDFKGHGTNVTGIIAAKANNGIGIAGINPGAQIMVLKVANPDGYANSLNIYRAIRYAADHEARIINISLGEHGVSKIEQLAINYAYAKGAFIVVAAGNKNEYIPENGPASAKRVFTVGAQDYEGTRSTISSWGPNLALIAPGEQIYTLFSRDAKWDGPSAARDRAYIRVSGTSFAAPIVSATASLLLVKNPNLTNEDLKHILLESANDMKDKGWDEKTGSGSLNAAAALRSTDNKDATVQVTLLKPYYDNKKLTALDVFGTVLGDFSEFSVELGSGKNATKLKPVAGPYTDKASDNWLCRIDGKQLKSNQDWTIHIVAKTKNGETKTAEAILLATK